MESLDPIGQPMWEMCQFQRHLTRPLLDPSRYAEGPLASLAFDEVKADIPWHKCQDFHLNKNIPTLASLNTRS